MTNPASGRSQVSMLLMLRCNRAGRLETLRLIDIGNMLTNRGNRNASLGHPFVFLAADSKTEARPEARQRQSRASVPKRAAKKKKGPAAERGS